MIVPFITELDRLWKPEGEGRLRLRIIGSAALMLQTAHARSTKDGDILETQEITPRIKERLLALGGKKTPLAVGHGLYIDVVINGLPFLPQAPKFHPCAKAGRLRHFDLEVLDVVDVVVSKLKRFNANDEVDVRAMVERKLVPHDRLIARFESAVERFSHDARSEDLPKVIKNLHYVEEGFYGRPPTEIELPDWLV